MEIINEQNMRMLQRLHEMPPSIPPTLFNRAYEEKQLALKRSKRNRIRKCIFKIILIYINSKSNSKSSIFTSKTP